MKRAGQARRDALVSLCPTGPGWVVVDVGADHGHVAHALGAIAVERAANRIGRRDVPWVVCDGLAGFRRVDVAVIAGMGAASIVGILDRGPRPERAAVVHAADDPQELRLMLAERGWRIDAEGVVRQGARIAEIVRVVPGDEPSAGFELRYGPRLLASSDPLYVELLAAEHARCAAVAARAAGHNAARHAEYAARASFLAGELRRRASTL